MLKWKFSSGKLCTEIADKCPKIFANINPLLTSFEMTGLALFLNFLKCEI